MKMTDCIAIFNYCRLSSGAETNILSMDAMPTTPESRTCSARSSLMLTILIFLSCRYNAGSVEIKSLNKI